MGVREANAADVARLRLVQVEPAKHETLFHQVQASQAVLIQRGERIAFGAVLRRTGRSLGAHLSQSLAHGGAHVVQASVELIDLRLLFDALRGSRQHDPFAKGPSIMPRGMATVPAALEYWMGRRKRGTNRHL